MRQSKIQAFGQLTLVLTILTYKENEAGDEESNPNASYQWNVLGGKTGLWLLEISLMWTEISVDFQNRLKLIYNEIDFNTISEKASPPAFHR